jgi:hypothetical protein
MPNVRTDGPCVTATKQNLRDGVRGRPLSEPAVEDIFAQAAAFVQRSVNAYEADIAAGEVGAVEGAGFASNEPPLHEGGVTGLLYGRVQSGKTAAMIAATALALDNGFRLAIVLTANNVTLVRQTAERFRALGRGTVLSTAKEGNDYEWEGQEDDLADDLTEEGLVLVCAKEATHLPNVIRLLQELDAAGHPAIVFDDEADAATPDTTLAARTEGRQNAPEYPSTTFRRVVENTGPGEEGDSIREVLPHHLFIQVTATPYVLFLQHGASPLRPKFTHLMEPGEGYRGGEAFFAEFDPTSDEQAPPLVLVADAESQQLRVARRNAPAPAGLQASITFFLLAAAAHAIIVNGGRFPEGGYKHLAHTSPRQVHHDAVMDVIARTLRKLLRKVRAADRRVATAVFADAYRELQRTELDMPAPLPPLDALLGFLATHLPQRDLVKVNAQTGEPRYGPTFNFVVGGNILGRGVTIDELLVTYYLREAQVSQMDTVWQHARMYGYRAQLMPFTRVYLPHRLALLFQGIHETEEDLRAVVPRLEVDAPVPLEVVAGARPTRPNALQPSAIQVYRGGRQVRPQAAVTDPARFGPADEAIRAKLQELRVPTDAERIEERFAEVALDALVALASLVPFDAETAGRWDPAGVASVLEVVRERFGGVGEVYVRSTAAGRRGRQVLRTGVLTGEEQRVAVARRRPVLALVYRDEEGFPPFWFPTLVFPEDMPPVVFNSESE